VVNADELGTAHVDLLDWDTKFWGKRAARVYVAAPSDLPETLERSSQLRIDWASMLVPSAEHQLITAAVRCGFEVVDTRVTMNCRIAERSAAVVEIEASLDEADALARIARTSFSDSRFFNDPHLNDSRCADFYETWLRNSLSGSLADAVLVERVNGEAAGFVTVRFDGDSASMPLVAVAQELRGRGVGRRMVASALDWLSDRGASDVEVITQLTNVDAIRLYTSAGFRLQNSSVWLHRWAEPSFESVVDHVNA
jgi:dTDP-4-amino-4,6-dideoxy-D-galactose acyltransferase